MSVRSIKITPKLIELDDAVIRVPNIATVAIGPNPAARFWIGLLVLFALGCFGSALLGVQAQAWRGQTDYSGGVISLFLGIGAAIWAISLWTRIALFISTSDGKMTLLVDHNPAFMREVMGRIREALLSDEHAPLHYTVNISAGRIENHSTSIANSAGASVVTGHVGSNSAAAARDRPSAAYDLIRRGLEVGQSAVAAASSSAGARLVDAGAKMSTTTRMHATSVTNSPGGIAVGGSVFGGHLATQVTTAPAADVGHLMDLLRTQRVEHAEMFNTYLALVQDHLEGGQTSRVDARNYWLWFIEQAGAYVSGLNGAADLIERISRVFRA